MTLQEILLQLQNTKKNGNGYTAKCPAHTDKQNSLSLSEKSDKVVLYCHAGCSVNAVCAALNIEIKDLFLSANGNGKPKKKEIKKDEVCAYDYTDENGELLFQNVRYLVTYDDGSKDKIFSQRHFDRNGKEVWNLTGVRRVPYRLPELLAALSKNPNEAVYLCEGEKDADKLREFGLTATSFKNWKDEFNDFIKGANVALLIDHDEPGIKQSSGAIKIIQPAVKTLKQIDLFENEPLPEKHGKDVFDWLTDGCSKDELLKIVADAPNFDLSDDEPENETHFTGEPKPLDLTLKPVETIDDDCLPKILADWLRPASAVIGCPFDFLVLSAITAAATLVGSRLRVKPLQFSDWFVVPNLYAGLVGLPSTKKTPALDETRKPILELQAKARKDFESLKNDYAIEKRLYEKQSDNIYKNFKGGNVDALKLQLSALTKPEEPKLKRFETNDVTASKLIQLLADNPNGFLLFRDELTGWLKSLEAEYDKSARAFILELWKGAIAYELARVDGREIQLESGTLSIVGGVQPSKLQRYITEAYSFDNSDGFAQRFLFAYPDIHKQTKKPSQADYDAMRKGFAAANETLKKLAEYDFHGKIIGSNGDVFHVVKFDPEAQITVDQWKDEIDAEAGKLETEDEAFSSFLIKLPKNCFAIALIFHCLENIGAVNFPDEISNLTTLKAIAYTDVLISHARRVFALGENQIFALAQTLIGKIKKGELKQGFTGRDVARKQWSGIKTPETVRDVLSLLTDYGYLKEDSPKGNGRPTVKYYIHPSLQSEIKDENELEN